MESIKHKLGILLLLLCLIAAAAAIWYMVAGLPGTGTMEGTLVKAVGQGGMMGL